MEPLALRLPALAITASLVAACSGAPTDPASMGDGDARVAIVQSALAQPTETVSPSSMRALDSDWQSFQQVVPAFDAVLSISASDAQGCLTGATQSDADIEPTEADGGATAPNGTYELPCVTDGKVTGQLSFQLEPAAPQDLAGDDAGVPQRVAVQLHDACAGDACVTGSAFAWIAPRAALGCTSLVTLAVSATVTSAGASRTFSFGAQGGAGRGSLLGLMVYFDDDGQSLAVQSSGDPASAGSVLVTGDGQSFECTLLPTGGRCDGPTSFVY